MKTNGVYFVVDTDNEYTVTLGRNMNYFESPLFDREASITGCQYGKVLTKMSSGPQPGGWVPGYQVSPSLDGNPIVGPGQLYHGDKVLFRNSLAYAIITGYSVPAWTKITTLRGNGVRLFTATPRKDNALRVAKSCVFCFDKPDATMRLDLYDGRYVWFLVYVESRKEVVRMDTAMFLRSYPQTSDDEWVSIK